MSRSKDVHVSVGAPWITILLIILITLKVAGVIDWSWWAVFMPVIIPLGIIGIIFLLIGMALIIGLSCDEWNRR